MTSRLVLLFLAAASVALVSVRASAIAPAEAVFAPSYKTDRGEILAGKAFAAKVQGCKSPLLLSALHLFGPAGGLGAQMTPREIRTAVKSVELRNIGNASPTITLKAESLTPDGAAPCCAGDGLPMKGVGDIAAFRASATLGAVALPVASTPAKRGDHVFVITSVIGATTGRLRFEAIVYGMQDGYLIYDFSTPGFVVQATSGAPVLNEAGEVVAVNLGGSTTKTGGIYGIGNPVSAWLRAIQASCASAK